MDVTAALRFVLDRSHLTAATQLPQVIDDAARLLGADGALIYLIDRDQRLLVPLGSDERQALSVEGTLPGRVYKTLTPLPSEADNLSRLWIPLLDGAERLGVLELMGARDQIDDHKDAQAFASLVAELLMTKGQYTDLYLQARSPRAQNLAAEVLWQQLPPLTYATDRFSVTCLLEPWTRVGGDAFDYASDDEVLHLAVFDGMGHGLSASLLTTVALASYRLGRRQGLDLVECASAVDEALAAQFGEDSFVTAVLAQLDLGRGLLSLVCAGHPPPLLLRDGRVVDAGDAVASSTPLGVGLRSDRLTEIQLQPGDIVMLYTDGLVEARSSAGEFFGVDRLGDFLCREAAAQQPPPETLRRLMRAVLEHQLGELQDDATCLLLQWITGTEQHFDLASKS